MQKVSIYSVGCVIAIALQNKMVVGPCALLIFLTAIVNHASAQDDFKGPVFYGEIGGAGGPHISINVEHILFKKAKWFVNGRLGYGLSRIQGESLNSVPVGLSIFHGAGRSHVELGLTLAYSQGRQYVVGRDVYSKALYFVPSLSYRFQKPDGGFFFRAGYTPLLKLQEYSETFHDIRVNHSFGLAVGYFLFRGSLAK